MSHVFFTHIPLYTWLMNMNHVDKARCTTSTPWGPHPSLSENGEWQTFHVKIHTVCHCKEEKQFNECGSCLARADGIHIMQLFLHHGGEQESAGGWPRVTKRRKWRTPRMAWSVPANTKPSAEDMTGSVGRKTRGWYPGKLGFDPCYIICGRKTVTQTYLSVVSGGILSGQALTHSFCLPQCESIPKAAYLPSNSPLSAAWGPVAGWLLLVGRGVMSGMCCTHTLLNHDTFSWGVGDGFFQKHLHYNQKSKYSSPTAAAFSLGVGMGLMDLEVLFYSLFLLTSLLL